ncbi:MAG: energy-coupling factor transporter transmembrane protein EcfT, partial [Candidatus Nezhaarchaeota archaeon]|nr:energy-coupling factor transporter transmembrane protein EcfT [Candidatus Nezhaarchaeota archaeon]
MGELERAALDFASLGSYEAEGGLLQKLHPLPRLSLLLSAQLLISSRSPAALCAGALAVVLMAALSRVPLAKLATKAALLSLPLAVLVALPSALLKPPQGLLPSLGPPTFEGLLNASTLVLRAYASVLNALTLALTTSVTSLTYVLSLAKPLRPLATILRLTYIHAFAKLKELSGRLLGTKSRLRKPLGLRGTWRIRLTMASRMLTEAPADAHALSLALRSRGIGLSSKLSPAYRPPRRVEKAIALAVFSAALLAALTAVSYTHL